MKSHQKEFTVEKMSKVFEVSVSGYYKYLNHTPTQREQRRAMLKQEIKKVFNDSKCRYGSPRITIELNMKSIAVSKVFVAKLMKEMGLKSIVRKKYKVTTDSNHKYPVVDNKLDRVFKVENENMAWVSDITYIPTHQGWLYLTTVIDLFDRKVIGWAFSSTLKTSETTLPAFHMAKQNRPILPYQDLLFHSDRGIQYASVEFSSNIEKHPNIKRSMSRKGNCWDNAVAESFFKTLKTELTNHYKYNTRQEAKLSIFEYIETFYNTKRRHQHLENLTMLEHKQQNNSNLKNVA